MRRTIWFGGTIVVLFVLAHDFWAWREPVPIGPWGLPRWIFVFAILQVVLAVAIHWFGKGVEANHSDTAGSKEGP